MILHRKRITPHIKEQSRQCTKSIEKIRFLKPLRFPVIQNRHEAICHHDHHRIDSAVRTGRQDGYGKRKDHEKLSVSRLLVPGPQPVHNEIVVIESGEGQEMGPAASIDQHLPFIQAEHQRHQDSKPDGPHLP